ncbi:LysR family transcriptional regulator [Desulfovibrio sp. OttesenSCG-928-O18]|nr:LysR family transcriptional regulator [Desulfovibrio sp. OttesenSCG-928-O18]
MYFAGVEAFLAISQTRNLAAAAEVLHLSASAVSYRLKTLEEELGVQLIERRKGVTQTRLTPTGESFVPIAERWSTLARDTALFSSTGMQIKLNISAPNSLTTYVFPRLYQALYQHNPAIRMRVSTEHTQESRDYIISRVMDIAFVMRKIDIPPTVTIKPFFFEDMILLRLATEGRASGDVVDIHDLDPKYEIFMSWGPVYQSWHDDHWDPIRPYRIRVDMAGMLPYLMTGPEHWSIIPLSIGRSLAASGNFVLQRLSASPPQRICYLMTHKYPSVEVSHGIMLVEHYLKLILDAETRRERA